VTEEIVGFSPTLEIDGGGAQHEISSGDHIDGCDGRVGPNV
jgi:hypothetical protein